MKEILLDALIDSLKILPFLFLMYFIIEFIETKTVKKFKLSQNQYAKLGPIIGAGFGIIPQCGFGVVATNLFSKNFISIGTLAAIYIATSDEAIPIMIANPKMISMLLPFILIKFIFAILIGYIYDFVFRKKIISKENIDESIETTGCCGHSIEHDKNEKIFKKYFLHPLFHSIKIFVFILIVNILMGLLIFYIKEENIVAFLNKTKYLQPLMSVIIGLIPNCASSVIISQLYVSSSLTFGATMAGLCINSGISFAVLFKENKNLKENLTILIGNVFASLLLGYFLTFIFNF